MAEMRQHFLLMDCMVAKQLVEALSHTYIDNDKYLYLIEFLRKARVYVQSL